AERGKKCRECISDKCRVEMRQVARADDDQDCHHQCYCDPPCASFECLFGHLNDSQANVIPRAISFISQSICEDGWGKFRGAGSYHAAFFPTLRPRSTSEAAVLTNFACGISPGRLGGAFHFDCAREKDVVFQMDMLMQIGFELLQGLIERSIADAGVRRWGIVSGDFT